MGLHTHIHLFFHKLIQLHFNLISIIIISIVNKNNNNILLSKLFFTTPIVNILLILTSPLILIFIYLKKFYTLQLLNTQYKKM